MEKQNKNFKKFILLIFLIGIVAIVAFLSLSSQFEKKPPVVSLKSNGFWNLKDDLKVNLSDQSGIRTYSVSYKMNNKIYYLNSKKPNTRQDSINFSIQKPNISTLVDKITIIVKVVDNSKWNFFQGNESVKEFELKIDTKEPLAKILVNSYSIRRGGSAVVVVKVKDDNLSNKYISFNGKYKFDLIPYVKKDYYATIIAWPLNEKEFKKVSLVAIDKANNMVNIKVPLYIKDFKSKSDHIEISETYINEVATRVLKKSGLVIPKDYVDIFKKENVELRAKNMDTIRQVSLENMSKKMVKNFKVKLFKRLSNSKTFAGFGDRREYFYDEEKIDEAFHLGIDWASIKHAKIRVSNDGKVIFSNFLGIYGNALIIDHGLGLQSLYAHTSKFNVKKGDMVKAGQYIGNTGVTGAVFGDHLHFGILVQGIESNPLEWMDKNWMKTRIFNILNKAKQIIRNEQ